MYLDVNNLEWWQAVLGIIGALGLSPAPWLLGLASGKIQFTAPSERTNEARISEIKAAHADALLEQDKNHERFIEELIKHHTQITEYNQTRYDDMKQSRDRYRLASNEQRDRADKASEAASQAVEAVQATNHLLESLAIVSREVVSNGKS